MVLLLSHSHRLGYLQIDNALLEKAFLLLQMPQASSAIIAKAKNYQESSVTMESQKTSKTDMICRKVLVQLSALKFFKIFELDDVGLLSYPASVQYGLNCTLTPMTKAPVHALLRSAAIAMLQHTRDDEQAVS